MDLISYILSRKYVDNSISGISGVLAGKNCTIYSSTKSGDTTTIVFKWTADDGTEKTTEIQVKDGETPTITSTEIEGGHTITFATTNPSQSVSFNVMDGEEGQRGVSVIRADVDANNYLRLELSDGNVINAGQIKTVSMVDNTLSLESANPVENRVITSALNNKVNKVSGKQLSTEDFTTTEKNKLANIENGAQVNTLENLIINGEEATIVDKKIALNIITSAVSNLQNYYLKSETYTKTEVEELIGSTVGVTIEIVQELPTIGQTNVIYFLPTETANVYSQYIYTSADGWVLIGSTSVDLSNYYTKGQVDALLNGKQNVLTIDAFPTSMSNNPVASGGVYSAIAQMQPQFQFTNMPVASQSNYGFVYQYVGNAGTYEPNMFYRCVYNTYAGEYRWEEVIFHATVTVDSELSPTSTNPVQNKVVKEALDAKQDIMQFSTMPSAQDNLGKIVQYTGATTATYQNGCFYKAVYDSEHDTYVWTIVRFSADISVDNVLSNVSENPVQNKVITKKFDEYKTAFTGTEEEWDALTSEEQNVYDIKNITDDEEIIDLGVYLRKVKIMLNAEDYPSEVIMYVGDTTADYTRGYIYRSVPSIVSGETVYNWVRQDIQPSHPYVQSDWLQNNSSANDYIKNKPTLGTASTKNSTDRVSPNNTDLVESQSVYSAINTALSSIYTPRGDISCAELTSDLLIAANVGNIYETSDSGTTTALFLQGAGHPIATGSNVGIINAGQGRILFNLMANAFDLTSYQKKDLTQAVEGQTTVEGALGALSSNKQPKTLTTSVESQTTVEGALGALSTNKASKVSGATNGNFAGLDANGNLTDSGKSVSDFASSAIMDGTTIDSFGDVETALADKQPKTLDTPITISETSQTTVEGALGGLANVSGVARKMTEIPSDGDLNNLLTEGWYYSDRTNTITNKPSDVGSNFVVHVYRQGTSYRIAQEITAYASGRKYIRIYNDYASTNKWGSWLKFATDSDISAITNIIPSDASASNQLVTQNVVKKTNQVILNTGDSGSSVTYKKIVIGFSGLTSSSTNQALLLTSRAGESWIIGTVYANSSSYAINCTQVVKGVEKIQAIKCDFTNGDFNIYIQLGSYNTSLKLTTLTDFNGNVTAELSDITETEYNNVTNIATINKLVIESGLFPDYSNRITLASGTRSWTATQNCYITYYAEFPSDGDLLIDGVVVNSVTLNQSYYKYSFNGYVKKGQVVTCGASADLGSSALRIFPLG